MNTINIDLYMDETEKDENHLITCTCTLSHHYNEEERLHMEESLRKEFGTRIYEIYWSNYIDDLQAIITAEEEYWDSHREFENPETYKKEIEEDKSYDIFSQ